MATIKDIANKAQVSAATVSRVLNYDETMSVSAETRTQKIKNKILHSPLKNALRSFNGTLNKKKSMTFITMPFV